MSPGDPKRRTLITERDASSMRAWSASMDAVIGLGFFGFLGWLLDRWLGTAPWLMLVLGLIGLAGGSYRFIREAIAINREASSRFRRDHPRGVPPLDDDPAEPQPGSQGQNPRSNRSPEQ